jgi:hypothetical protein
VVARTRGDTPRTTRGLPVGGPNKLRGEANMTTEEAPNESPNESHSEPDDLVDEVEEESFPASDPPSSWAGPISDSGA